MLSSVESKKKMERSELILQLKNDVLECLNLSDTPPDDLDENAPLFGDAGLGLDSIDALEIVLMLEKKYSLTIEDKSDAKTLFASISSMADRILSLEK